MTDEPTEQNASGGETTGETENPEQTATETVAETSTPDPQEAEVTVTEVKSERGKNRVQDLANEAKVAKTEAAETARENATLKEDLSKITTPKQNPVKGMQTPPWTQPNDTRRPLGAEVSQDQYWGDVDAKATAQANTIVDIKIGELKRDQLVKDNYMADIASLESDYPEVFNSNDSELKTEFAKQHELYRKTIAVDPNVRFKDFAGPLFKARSIGVEVGKGEAVETITEQAGEAAVKPSTTKNDTLTTEEQLISAMKKGELSPADAEKKIAQLQ